MGAGTKILTMSIGGNGVCTIQAHGLMEDGEYTSEEIYRALRQLMAAGWEMVKSKSRDAPDLKGKIMELYFRNNKTN